MWTRVRGIKPRGRSSRRENYVALFPQTTRDIIFKFRQSIERTGTKPDRSANGGTDCRTFGSVTALSANVYPVQGAISGTKHGYANAFADAAMNVPPRQSFKSAVNVVSLK